jgi:hypothetical protein
MPVKNKAPGSLSQILGGLTTPPTAAHESPALEREKKSRRKTGKRSSGTHTLMGVYVNSDLQMEFQIACKRKRLEYSEVVERLVKGFVEGRFTV